MTGNVCDELEFGFGWIASEPARLERASHALADNVRVWLIDPVDIGGLPARIETLGEPAGVVQLLDRHERDCARLASRFAVPHLKPPFGREHDLPFEILRVVDIPLWREAALWWPERRTLVVADALGTAAYYLEPSEQLAVHPLLRLLPPRTLLRLEPDHVLCGHGPGVHGHDATKALAEALQTARARIPGWLANVFRRKSSG
jgi:hypothetical protein